MSTVMKTRSSSLACERHPYTASRTDVSSEITPRGLPIVDYHREYSRSLRSNNGSHSPRTSASSGVSTRSSTHHRRSSSPTTASQGASTDIVSPVWNEDEVGRTRSSRKRASEAIISASERDQDRQSAEARLRTAEIVEPNSSSYQANRMLEMQQSTQGGQLIAAGHVCLCQPEPKIPRPRNAFILYRQHHQQKVASANPGLANPQISIIIGDQWKKETPEVKAEWKTLAEEEKARHQQQYPEYRYQPRRAGRRNSFEGTGNNSSEKYRCPKCGGRSIISPSAPLSAGVPSTSSKLPSPDLQTTSTHSPRPPNHLPPPILPPPHLNPSTPTSATPSRYLPMLSNLSINSSQSPRGRFANHHSIDPRSGSGLQISPPRNYPSEEMLSPISPGPKRRRHEPPHPGSGNVGPQYTSTPMSARHSGPYPYPPPPHSSEQGRRESLPRPNELLLRGQDPRAAMHQGQQGPAQASVLHRRNPMNYGESLSLPPLQIGSGAPEGDLKKVVASMPFLNKVLLLGRVAPPIRIPTPRQSPAPQSNTNEQPNASNEGNHPTGDHQQLPKRRGAIIAVEAEDTAISKDLASWLETFLKSEGAFNVRKADGPTLPETDFATATQGFEAVHEVVQRWCTLSREMVSFITSSIERTPPTPAESTAETSDTAINDAPAANAVQADSSGIPTLIIPSYHLTATDAFAARTPLQDAYGVTDHWQWMATQWRGTAGPDLTIYIKDVNSNGTPASPPSGGQHSAHSHSSGGAGPSSAPSIASSQTGGGIYGVSRGHGVEINEASRVLVVKRDSGSAIGRVGGLSEGALRRVGFEVGEWVRGVSAGGR